MMRRTVVLLASISLAVLLASGAAVGLTRSEQPSGHPIEPAWVDEPVAPKGSVQASLFAGHWTSVTPEETLYYYNPGKIYPAAVAHGAKAWNALDTRFNNKGVRLIKVGSNDKATVRIKRIRRCDEDMLGFSGYREGRPNLLAINTCVVNRYGAKIRNHLLTHELGHHLGSGHQRMSLCGKSIMVEHVPCGRKRIVLTKPGERDVSWYQNRWVR